jgi:hypothetical protein
MVIGDVRLMLKTGGKSGTYRRAEDARRAGQDRKKKR